MKITIDATPQVGIDIQWLHGILHKAFNQPGSREYEVTIKDHETIVISVAKEYSPISISGAAFDVLAAAARAEGLTVPQMIEWMQQIEREKNA